MNAVLTPAATSAKVTVQRRRFLDAISEAWTRTDKRSSIPVLRTVLNALEGVEGAAKFCFATSDKAIEIRDKDGYRCVVMPMRI